VDRAERLLEAALVDERTIAERDEAVLREAEVSVESRSIDELQESPKHWQAPPRHCVAFRQSIGISSTPTVLTVDGVALRAAARVALGNDDEPDVASRVEVRTIALASCAILAASG
jgi:hypothetical protein